MNNDFIYTFLGLSQKVKIAQDWGEILKEEFDKPYFQHLVSFVKQEYNQATIYPPGSEIFRAFDECPLSQVRVVIVGQDPYHGADQANGLCFSVRNGVPIPPSLSNIFKELSRDFDTPTSKDGDLVRWSRQGVLLLNATLTVRASSPGSHQNQGWETFTDAVIRTLAQQKTHLVFILWGSYAQKKGSFIDRQRHLVLEAAHPSPFSAHKGFFGCGHFSKANAYLQSNGHAPVQW